MPNKNVLQSAQSWIIPMLSSIALVILVLALVDRCSVSEQKKEVVQSDNKKDIQTPPLSTIKQEKDPTSAITLLPTTFDQLPGWSSDDHSEAWPALVNNCKVMSRKAADWNRICLQAFSIAPVDGPIPSKNAAKLFFERHFHPFQLIGEKNKNKGLMTGYYEPLLQGSYTKTERYRYAVYAPPKKMLTIELDSLFPELKGKRVRGLLQGNKVIPFYERAAIEGDSNLLAGDEILWVDNRDDLFFLHIQGSGRAQLPNGHIIGVGYANQNGQPYRSIGQVLINHNELERTNVNLFTIKQWLRKNPEMGTQVLNANPSYVFFSLRENVKDGPIGSLNVPLTPERSIAIDPKVVSLGSLMYVDSHYPDESHAPLQKLVFAQDTGGAIKGTLRADMFYGTGKVAEKMAGLMKEYGQYFLLKPKPQ